MKTKICSKCNEEKLINRFHHNKRAKDGRHNYCKICRAKYDISPSRTGGHRRKADLKRNFNLTLKEYNRMALNQKGLCAICKKPETGTYKNITRHLAVDHDHKTGKIRGLLCTNCNQLLGHAKDNIETLELAIVYLKK